MNIAKLPDEICAYALSESCVLLAVRRSIDMGIFQLSPKDRLTRLFQPASRAWWLPLPLKQSCDIYFVGANIRFSLFQGSLIAVLACDRRHIRQDMIDAR